MREFDPIDLFFIAIICGYFLTLICIGIAFLVNKKNNNKTKVDIRFNNEKEVEENKMKKKLNLSDIPIIRTLFLKEVKKEEPKILSKEIIKIENKIEVNSKKTINNNKVNTSNKKSSNNTNSSNKKSTNSKKSSNNRKSKTSSTKKNNNKNTTSKNKQTKKVAK